VAGNIIIVTVTAKVHTPRSVWCVLTEIANGLCNAQHAFQVLTAARLQVLLLCRVLWGLGQNPGLQEADRLNYQMGLHH
jgi:hypothetical protein